MSDLEAFPSSGANFCILSADARPIDKQLSSIPNLIQGMMLQLADGSIQACNIYAQELLGLTIEQIQGLTSLNGPWKIVHEDGSPFPGETHPAMMALQTGQPCFNVVMGFYTLTGELIWLNVSSQPLFQANASTPYAVVTTFVQTAPPQPQRSSAPEVEVLERSQHVLDTIENISDAFCSLDRDWCFIYVNAQAAQLLNRTSESLLGKNYWEEFPETLGSRFEQEYRRALAEQVTVNFETFYAPHNRWYSVRAYPVTLGLAIYFQDVTAQKQAQEALLRSEERYRTLFESIDEGFCIIEMLFDENNAPVDYRFLEINPAFERHTGLAQAAGKTARQLLPNLEEHWFDIYGKIVLTGEPIRFEQGSVDMNRWFEVFAFRFGNPSERKVAVRFKDVSDRKRTEDALRQSEERLSLALEGAGMATWDVDIQTDKRIWSSRHFTILGYVPISTEDVTAKMWRSRVHPDDVAYLDREVDEARQTQSIFFVEHRIIRADNGETRWLSSFGRFLYNEAGEAVRSVGIFFDISNRKQVEEDLRQKNAILELINQSAPTPIFVKDRQGRIIYANPATLEALEKPASEVLGYRDYEIYSSPEYGAIVSQNDQRIMESGQAEVVEESPDGIRTFLGTKAPYRNEAGEVIGLIGIANDITARVQLERDRERVLLQEQAAREAAEKANQIKDEFLAVLSHELRTPLNPILGWAKLLQSRKLSEAKTAEAIATIERNAKLQSQLIEDLLDVSRILRGKLALTFVPVSVENIIVSAIETVRLAAENKNIKIQTVFELQGAQVSGDAGRLQQVIWNLLSNAVKFTPPEGQVTVTLSQQLDRQACITVSDTGKGIDPDFVPYVFDHFRQEDGAITRKFGGLGLGLAIARQITELHGGTVHANSLGENQGATFTVTLPLLLETSEITLKMDAPPSSQALPLQNLSILVVDDERDSCDFIAFVLEQAGANVVKVSSGVAALEALQKTPLDGVVSDIGMPDMDGYMLIRQIRLLPEDRGGLVPAIALTAYAGELNQQQALQAGFQQHVTKPVEPEQLIEVMMSVCKSRP
jgi:PAS domain S-box-containing protein